MVRFNAVHPVVDVRDVRKSAQWYVDSLGFDLLFIDDGEPNYAVLGRDGVEIHLQWHSGEEWEIMSGSVYRFLLDEPDSFFAECRTRGVELPHGKSVEDTTWGTREFGLYDPDGNALFFYRDR